MNTKQTKKLAGRSLGGFAGAIWFLLLMLFPVDPANPAIGHMMAVAFLMATWWIFEVIPLAVTALLPVVLLPLLGISDGKSVSSAYFNHIIFLFIGGFLMAIAMQRWNLHKRLAMKILWFTGTTPQRILLGFMLATAFLSMWISNTATAMLMVPIAMSVVGKLEELHEGFTKHSASGIMLGIAYSASLGGIATLVGTPPNLSFARIYHIMFPMAPEISFAQWMLFALPLSMVMLAATWLYLKTLFFRKITLDKSGRNVLQRPKEKMSQEEKIVATLFALLALLWIFRADINLGVVNIPGWARIFSRPEFLNDGTVGILVALPLFLIPSKNEKGKRLMDWEAAGKIPWDIVLLFGGGFALAGGINSSGLADWIGQQLQWTSGIHPLLIILTVTASITFLTELTSNTATAEMALPILAGLAQASHIHPVLLMVPAAVAASMAFMLPVATPPNAIVFGTGMVNIHQMARTGFFLNLLGILLLTLVVWFWGSIVFATANGAFPANW